ncbi:MAG: flagellar biosynthetic protein FliO [Methyloceanibacter sp.]|jgi:flagellar protein FliO/FliZ|nr:flagellar biosynthetic protein FliO [Methyloceanibacter sp.]
MPDPNTIILAIATILFVVALVALMVWAFRTFVTGRPSAHGFLRPRDRRLGVVETASVDARRKLILVRRDDVEHLIITGGPVDMVIETGIKGRPHLEPPLEDVIIAKSETRPVPDFSKT